MLTQWELGLGVAGQGDLYVDGEELIDNTLNQEPSVLFVSGQNEKDLICIVQHGCRGTHRGARRRRGADIPARGSVLKL